MQHEVQFFPGPSGGFRALYRGYIYTLDRSADSGRKYWRCRTKLCKGRLSTYGDKVQRVRAHSHGPTHGQGNMVSAQEAGMFGTEPEIEPVVDNPVIKRETSNVSIPKDSSILNVVRSTASSLSDAVRLAPTTSWPEVLDLLQQTMNEVAEFVTNGRVSHVDIVPMNKETRYDQLMTLRELVVNDVLDERATLSSMIRPCSVLVDRITDTHIGGATVDASYYSNCSTNTDMITRIKEEKEDDYQEYPRPEKTDESVTKVVTNRKPQVNSSKSDNTHPPAEKDNSDDDMDVFWPSDNDVEDSDNDVSWKPRASTKPSPRKARRPKKAPRKSSSGSLRRPSRVYAKGNEWKENYTRGNRFQFLKMYERYDPDALFETSTNSECFFCEPDSRYKSKSLSDFVQHLEKAEHVDMAKRGYRSLDCPICDEIIRNRILQRGGTLIHQTLRLVGRVTQHMWIKHGFKPDKTFIPVYECNHCPKKLYSDIEFVDHKRTAHRNVTFSQKPPDELLLENMKDDDMDDGDGQDIVLDKPAKFDNFGMFPYDSTRPCFGLPNSTYESGQLIVNETNSFDIDATFPASADTRCPFCVEEPKYESTTLRNLLKHMKEEKHLFVKGNEGGFNISCPQCETVETCMEKEGVKEETLLLNLLGLMVHHMVEEHSFKPDRAFLPSFQCKCCSFLSFSEGKYQSHVVESHMYDSSRLGPHYTGEYGPARAHRLGGRLPIPAEAVQSKKHSNRAVVIERYENYNVDKPFEAEIDAFCPFCPEGAQYKSNSLSDFIQHMTESEHVDFSVSGYRRLNCPQCSESARNRIWSKGGNMDQQILRLVGKAVQHMINTHQYTPVRGFLRPYNCDLCTKEFYSDQDFLEHLRVAHRNARWDKNSPDQTSNESSSKPDDKIYDIDKDVIPMRGKFRNRFVIAEKFENYDLDEDFPEGVNRKCPLCPVGEEYQGKNLADVMEHLEKAKHMNMKKYGLRCMNCPVCNKELRNRVGNIDGCNETQIIRLLGKMVQHMIDRHELNISHTFLPRYKCNKCHYQSFCCAKFLDHLTRSHMPKAPKKGASTRVATSSSSPSASAAAAAAEAACDMVVPEDGLDLDKAFDNDAHCMFCKTDSAAPVKSLRDFLTHMEEAAHFTIEEESECSVLCPLCTQDFRGLVPLEGDKKNPQLLHIINRAIQHIHSEHKYHFTEPFPHRFKCDQCGFTTYSGLDLTIHIQQTHTTQPVQELAFSDGSEGDEDQEDDLEDGRNLESIFDVWNAGDMCKLKLTEAIFEGKWDPVLSLTLPFRKPLEAHCPLCPSGSAPLETLTHMVGHLKSKGHVKRIYDHWEMACNQCSSYIVRSDHHESENEAANVLSTLGKWIVHRVEEHEWCPPSFFPNYQCSFCRYSNFDPRECKHHMKSCIQTNPRAGQLQCPVCKKLKPIKLYRRHVKRCAKNVNIDKQQCDVCKNMISTRHFRGHQQMCAKPKDQYKRSPCPICGKMLLDEMHYHKSNLRKHIMICHTDVFPHLCSVCSMQFKRRNDLNRHMFQKHELNISQQIPKYCDQCDYRTLSQTHFTRHLTTHRTTAEVTCDKCGKQYKSVYHLNVHLRTAHRRKETSNIMFRCTQCSYTTPIRGYFTKHLRYHRDMKSGAGHWCTICNYNARFPVVLKNHMRNVHKIDITKVGSAGATMFKSSRTGRKYKNMKLPGEASNREPSQPIVPTVGKMVRTKKRGRVAQAEMDLALEDEEERSGLGNGQQQRDRPAHQEGLEGAGNHPTSGGVLRLNQEEQQKLDYHHSEGPSGVSAGLGLGEMVEGLGGMMNPAGVPPPHPPPPQQGPGESDMSYSLPPGGYPFTYNLSNMYY